MLRVREGRAGGEAGYGPRPRHVRDIEDEEPVMPVADIQPVAEPQRMVAARPGHALPRIVLAAGVPLAGDPPAAHLFRPLGIADVEDQHDVAGVALDRGRDVGVARSEEHTSELQSLMRNSY